MEWSACGCVVGGGSEGVDVVAGAAGSGSGASGASLLVDAADERLVIGVRVISPPNTG